MGYKSRLKRPESPMSFRLIRHPRPMIRPAHAGSASKSDASATPLRAMSGPSHAPQLAPPRAVAPCLGRVHRGVTWRELRELPSLHDVASGALRCGTARASRVRQSRLSPGGSQPPHMRACLRPHAARTRRGVTHRDSWIRSGPSAPQTRPGQPRLRRPQNPRMTWTNHRLAPLDPMPHTRLMGTKA
jgi:hypothetical protein